MAVLPLGQCFAHTLNDAGPDRWERLETHLERVAALAGEFADVFNAKSWGETVGRWHDLGKYSEAFQHYLKATSDADASEETSAPGRVDHSTFGAQYAARTLKAYAGQIVAFCIAGHHGHLPDATSGEESTFRSSLQARLAAGPERVPPVRLPPIPEPPPLQLPFKALNAASE